MAIDPFTIARLGVGAGQLVRGISTMRDREGDRRGQERIRQLLAQAQGRNLRQAQAIAGSGEGVSPALAQRAALQSVNEANQAATAAALDQEAALALQDRERADRLAGAELGALGAFGGQLLTALQDAGEDSPDVSKEAMAEMSRQIEAKRNRGSQPSGTAGSVAQAATAAGEAAQAATAAGEAASDAVAAEEAAAEGRSLLDRFLSPQEGESPLDKNELEGLERQYGIRGQMRENPRELDPTFAANPYADPSQPLDLGMRTEDISGAAPLTRAVAIGETDEGETVTRQDRLRDGVQDVVDQVARERVARFEPVTTVSGASGRFQDREQGASERVAARAAALRSARATAPEESFLLSEEEAYRDLAGRTREEELAARPRGPRRTPPAVGQEQVMDLKARENALFLQDAADAQAAASGVASQMSTPEGTPSGEALMTPEDLRPGTAEGKDLREDARREREAASQTPDAIKRERDRRAFQGGRPSLEESTEQRLRRGFRHNYGTRAANIASAYPTSAIQRLERELGFGRTREILNDPARHRDTLLGVGISTRQIRAANARAAYIRNGGSRGAN